MTERDRSSERRETSSRDRGVSEVLSYSLIFGLIVASIAIVTVGGLGSLQSAQDLEQVSNAERAFDVLDDNLGDIYSQGAPSRSTEVSLGESELFFDDNVTLEVTFDSGRTISEEIRPIVFRVDGDRKLVYEVGAVIRANRDGGIMLKRPPFSFVEGSGAGDGRVHFPIVQTFSPDVQSMGSTTVLVRGEATNRTVLMSYLDGGTGFDTIEIESPRFEVWADYFESRDYCDDPVSTSGSTVTCTVDSDYDPQTLYVSRHAIRIELIR